MGEGYRKPPDEPRQKKMPRIGARFAVPVLSVVAYDYGIKFNILRNLAESGCRVKVVPADTSAEDVLAINPDGIFLSNGPGDPDAVSYAKENVQKLIGRKPIFGICLGHQIMGFALGGKTYKLKFGHHGGNQPVMDLTTRKVEITAQNHGFAVDADSLKGRWKLPTSILTTTRWRVWRIESCRSFPCSIIPSRLRGRTTRIICFKRFIELMDQHQG